MVGHQRAAEDAAPSTDRGSSDGLGSPAEPPGTRPRHLRWPLIAAALAVLLLVGIVAVRALDDEGAGPDADADADADAGGMTSEPASPPGTVETYSPLTRADWDGTAVGVFRTTDPEAVEEYEEWLGRPVDYVIEYSSREDWRDISEPEYLFDAWEGTDRRLVLGIAMLPSEVDASIQEGAAGEYDEYFRTLAEGLVDAGHEDAILRVGWEFNLDSWTWASPDAEAWVEYWRRIVLAMRGVEGADFRFDWNVNNGAGMRYDAVDYYPGDEYVDYVGVDAYDVSAIEGTYPLPEGCDDACARERRERAWDEQIYGGDRGLRFWSDFAEQHDKLLSIPEWGVWERFDGIGGGDNAFYITQMATFIADPENRVAYQAYFERNNDQGYHALMGGRFPDARDRYLELFGG